MQGRLVRRWWQQSKPSYSIENNAISKSLKNGWDSIHPASVSNCLRHQLNIINCNINCFKCLLRKIDWFHSVPVDSISAANSPWRIVKKALQGLLFSIFSYLKRSGFWRPGERKRCKVISSVIRIHAITTSSLSITSLNFGPNQSTVRTFTQICSEIRKNMISQYYRWCH